MSLLADDDDDDLLAAAAEKAGTDVDLGDGDNRGGDLAAPSTATAREDAAAGRNSSTGFGTTGFGTSTLLGGLPGTTPPPADDTAADGTAALLATTGGKEPGPAAATPRRDHGGVTFEPPSRASDAGSTPTLRSAQKPPRAPSSALRPVHAPPTALDTRGVTLLTPPSARPRAAGATPGLPPSGAAPGSLRAPSSGRAPPRAAVPLMSPVIVHDRSGNAEGDGGPAGPQVYQLTVSDFLRMAEIQVTPPRRAAGTAP